MSTERHFPDKCPICKMHKRGLRPRDIALALNRTRGWIYRHLNDLGVEPNTIKAIPRRELFFELRREGFSIKDAARQAGIAIKYACSLGSPYADQSVQQGAAVPGGYISEDAYVAALIEAGGFERLSEKPTRTGPVVCLPIIPFQPHARAA